MHAHSGPAALAALLLMLSACGDQGLSQAWQLDRLRILAVRAEPAEPQPGEYVSFEALYYLPDDLPLQLAVWVACIPESGAVAGCSVDPAILESLNELDFQSLSPEEQAALLEKLLAAGLIGAEPILAPQWIAPADALDALEDDDKLEGVTAMVNITAIPQGATSDQDIELSYKRLPISLATTPNHNPDLEGFVVDETALAEGAVASADWGQDMTLTPVLAADAIETYIYRLDDGSDEERIEEPYMTWYAEAGSFDQPYSLYPTLDVIWTAPAAGDEAVPDDGIITLLAVIRDRRGGMGWARLDIMVGATGAP